MQSAKRLNLLLLCYGQNASSSGKRGFDDQADMPFLTFIHAARRRFDAPGRVG
jgi:hypothetical protein